MEESVRNETVFKAPNTSSGDMDFGDVFGGAPRRLPIQEGSVMFTFRGSEASEPGESPPGSASRRRCLNDGFFDDIFRGDESYNSPRPSLPTQLSLPANMTEATEYPIFVPHKHGEIRVYGARNLVNSPQSSSSSSRFYHRSPLDSFSSEDSSSTATTDPKDYPTNGSLFHFSIHKWGGIGIPMLKPLVSNRSVNSNRVVEGNVKEKEMESQVENDLKKTMKNNLPLKSDLKPLRALFTEVRETETTVQIVDVKRGNKEKLAKRKEQTKRDTNREEVDEFCPKDRARREILRDDEKDKEEFMVQELSYDPEEASEEKKDLDAKILQWSAGKKGNIRSLLSTLQLVLWPGNGWIPVPLVDLIEANAVKRAYQKALLRLHPDKLQQNGAALDQKYIAEKVFDILQDAWDQFTALGIL